MGVDAIDGMGVGCGVGIPWVVGNGCRVLGVGGKGVPRCIAGLTGLLVE